MTVSAQSRGKLATAMGDYGAAANICDAIDAGAGDTAGTNTWTGANAFAGALTISAAGLIGFYGVTPVAQRGAYTQTYSTATRTHANATAAALTVSDGTGTNDGTIGAITGDASVIAAVQELAAQIAKLVTDLANVKGVVNSLIDDSQAMGIAQ